MTLHQSFEHVRTIALWLGASVDNKMANLTASKNGLDMIAQAMNHIRTHGLVQLLCEIEQPSKFEQEDYIKALNNAFRTLLDDIQFEGECISYSIKVSKTGVAVITLRREEPRKVDTPAPTSA